MPVRPTYSAELLSTSFNGSLPRSSGAVGSAPDLSNGNSNEQRTSSSSGNDSRSSPVTNVWTNPYHDSLHHHHHHVQNHHHRTAYDSSRHHAVSGMQCLFCVSHMVDENLSLLQTRDKRQREGCLNPASLLTSISFAFYRLGHNKSSLFYKLLSYWIELVSYDRYE